MTKILQMKISLDGIKPEIWRRFTASDSMSFGQLHEIIQAVMGWENYHMYSFDVGNTRVEAEDRGAVDSMWAPFMDKKPTMPSTTKLSKLITRKNQKFSYLYDFGDSWRHTITVEKILEDKEASNPVCIAGECSCPPEDCGSTYGYEELLEIRKNKKHPEYKEMIVDWLGEDFAPERFDIREVNRVLNKINKTFSRGKEGMKTVKCSSCGSKVDCPAELDAEYHLCEVCTEALSGDMTKDDAEDVSERMQYIEKHMDDMTKLGMFIHTTSLAAMKRGKADLKKTGKKDMAEAMHFDGAMSAIKFFMYAGMPPEALKEMLQEIDKFSNLGEEDKNLQGFMRDAQKVVDVVSAVGKRLEGMDVSRKEFDRLMKSVDPKAFKAINEDPNTEEGLIKIMNKLIFRGDWDKQLKWTEKWGTSKDVEYVKRGWWGNASSYKRTGYP